MNQIIDNLLSQMTEAGDKGEKAADEIVKISTNSPELVGVYFSQMVKIAERTNNVEDKEANSFFVF